MQANDDAINTAPTGEITLQQAARLVGRILPLSSDEADDDAPRALIAIIRHFAYQNDWARRDVDAGTFEQVIYPLTAHSATANTQFVKSADALLGKPSLANDERSDKDQAEQPDIKDVYARVAAAMEELFAHPDCAAKVHEFFAEAQLEIINHSDVQGDAASARLFLADAMADLGGHAEAAAETA